MGQYSARGIKQSFAHFSPPLSPFWNFALLCPLTPLYNLGTASHGRLLSIQQTASGQQMILGVTGIHQNKHNASHFYNGQIRAISFPVQFEALYAVSRRLAMPASSNYWLSNIFYSPTSTFILAQLHSNQFCVGDQTY